MAQFPLLHPKPSFEALEKVLKGEKNPEQVHFVEIGFDPEPVEAICRDLFGIEIPSYLEIVAEKKKRFKAGSEVVMLNTKKEKLYLKRFIEFCYRLGYDYVPDTLTSTTLSSILLPEPRITKAITPGSQRDREWAEEGMGIITTWQEFESYPWERIKLLNLEGYYKFLFNHLPDGMKVTVSGSLFEQIMEKLLGYEGMFYGLYRNPQLVKAVIDRWGEILLTYYQKIVPLEGVGALFHADDLGYKSDTLISPDMLRDLVFPWFQKYAALAHENGKMFWYHCCGNVRKVLDDLIDDVKIDAFHSFQDTIIPVIDFEKLYGSRIAVLGGVDMDKISRLAEPDLRSYVCNILAHCVPGGGYALGTGNSVADYIPVKNFLAMLEEGFNWRPH